ncbi:FAD-binding protein [Acetobacter sp. TBRC 12305]|uniref:FAD-binding protein n=1 Tax=Acetobacter garciniae TaxID=2817435 RepID=A0A939HMU2_9PROT|nr:FAD-binding protein [Acetobacter garciniae]MBO1326537.1 FAD-binding protein [Acetobacter garciniae]MBX0346281.1 FAD-binding protein [Acetobacter garciniae]
MTQTQADTTIQRPATVQDVADIIMDAAQAGCRLAITGNGTRPGLGNPVTAAGTLSLGGLDKIDFYDPDDLVIRAGAGITLDELEAILLAKGQYLPFEPPRYAALYGTDPRRCTLGGAVATALSGPRRILSGAVRDFVLGVEGVNGQGDVFKAGGRTMKNVTGYDLAKLVTGSHGTLAALTSVTIKVLPAPRAEISLVLPAAGLAEDTALFSAIRALPLGVGGLARRMNDGGTCEVVIRVEGTQPGVAGNRQVLEGLLQKRGGAHVLVQEESQAQWADIRELACLHPRADELVWRVNLPATAVTEFVARAREAGCINRFFIDWAGGVVFSTMRGVQPEVDVLRYRKMAESIGAKATMLRAPCAVLTRFGAFPPTSSGVAALAARTRAAFDPAGILNPGRMSLQPQEQGHA